MKNHNAHSASNRFPTPAPSVFRDENILHVLLAISKSRVVEWIIRNPAREPASEHDMVMTESPIDRRALDRLEKLGGSELILRVIDQYLDKIPQRMEAACDRGRAGDLNAVGRALQSIKSAAGNVGATEVSEFAARIEQAAIEGAKDLILPLLCQLDDMLGQVETWLQREKNSLRSSRGVHWH